MRFLFQLPFLTMGRSKKRENCIFWFGNDQTYQKHVLKLTANKDRKRYLKVETTYIIREMKVPG